MSVTFFLKDSDVPTKVDLYWHRGTTLTLDTELQMYIKPKTASTATFDYYYYCYYLTVR